jgi:ATP-dependent Lon protease
VDRPAAAHDRHGTSQFDRRLKLLYLLRLVPLIQTNYNLIELGQRDRARASSTGRSRLRHPRLRRQDDGRHLFYNMATSRIGLVGLWDTIAFDEVPASSSPTPRPCRS